MKRMLFVLLILAALVFPVEFVLEGNYSTEDQLGEPWGIWYYNGHFLTYSTKYERVVVLDWDDEDEEFEIVKRVGSSDSSSRSYISDLKDIWMSGDLLFLLGSGNKILIFNASDGYDLITVVNDGSFIPEDGSSIVYSNGYMYLGDLGDDSVKIAKAYDLDDMKFISDGSINYVFLGDFNAQFDNPSDLYIDGDLLFVCDRGKDAIKMFNISEDYDYVGDYSDIDKYITLKSPRLIALDDDYLYVSDGLLNTIKVIFRQDARTIDELEGFDSISGIYSDGERLYVADSGDERIYVYYINKTSKLSYDDIVPILEEFGGKYSKLCKYYDLSEPLDLALSELCDELKELNETNVTGYLDEGKYDDAYSLLVDSMIPKVEGGLSYYPKKIDDSIDEIYYNLNQQLKVYENMNLTGVPKTKLLDLRDLYSQGLREYRHENYTSAYNIYLEIDAGIKYLDGLLNSSEEDENEDISEEYMNTLNDYKEQYASIKSTMDLYGLSHADIDRLIESIRENIESSNYDEAYDQLDQLSEKLADASERITEHKNKVDSVKAAFSVMESKFKDANQSFLFMTVDLSKPLSLYAQAKEVYMKEPDRAASYLKEASSETDRAVKEFKDNVFLFEVAIVVFVFILVIVGLLSSGVLLYKHHKKKKENGPPKWTGWKGKK